MWLGEDYTRFKKAISDCFKENSPAKFEKLLNENESATMAQIYFPYLCMALYQNVTLLYKEMNTMPCDIFIPILNRTYSGYKFYWEPLLKNKLPHRLAINNETWADIELNLVLVQLKYSILFSKSSLIKLFADLINKPLMAKDSFLPTMPQDSIFDIKNAIISGNKTDSPKFYGNYKKCQFFVFQLILLKIILSKHVQMVIPMCCLM